MLHADPLDQLAALGLRIAWLPNYDHQVSYTPDLGLIIADPDLCRREVLRLALRLLNEQSETDLPDAS